MHDFEHANFTSVSINTQRRRRREATRSVIKFGKSLEWYYQAKLDQAIYLGSTLSAPDKDALIKCVCGVYRAHLVQAERSAIMGMNATHHIVHGADVHAIFHDRRSPGDYRYLEDTTSVPSLDAITDFYRSIFLIQIINRWKVNSIIEQLAFDLVLVYGIGK